MTPLFGNKPVEPKPTPLYFYTFSHIDDFTGFYSLERFGEKLIEKFSIMKGIIEATWMEIGWHGDGDFKIFFMPPFLIYDGYSSAEAIYLVKQSYKGASFIASHFELPSHNDSGLLELCKTIMVPPWITSPFRYWRDDGNEEEYVWP